MSDVQYNDQQRLVDADITIGDLKHLIAQYVQQAAESAITSLPAERPIREILASMRHNLWTPPPGAPTNLELLREDRKR